MGYITLAEFKNTTGIKLDDTVVLEAINNSAQEMKRKIFIPQVYQTKNTKKVHKLTYLNPSTEISIIPDLLAIADINEDGIVDKNDINAFEIDSDFNITDRNSDISNFNSKYGIVTFSIDVPINNRLLIIEFHTAISQNDKIKYMLKELNKLMAANYLFRTIPYSRLQRGISNWSINSVSVSFDLNSIQSIIEENNKKINSLYSSLTPILTRVTRIRRPSRSNIEDFYASITRTDFGR